MLCTESLEWEEFDKGTLLLNLVPDRAWFKAAFWIQGCLDAVRLRTLSPPKPLIDPSSSAGGPQKYRGFRSLVTRALERARERERERETVVPKK